MVNRTVCLQIDEIKRYSNALLLEQKANRILENRINLEVEEKTIALRRLEEGNRQKDSYYDWYLKMIDKKNNAENKLIIGLTIAVTIITSLVAVIIKGV